MKFRRKQVYTGKDVILKKDSKNYYKKARILSKLEIEDNRKSFQEEFKRNK